MTSIARIPLAKGCRQRIKKNRPDRATPTTDSRLKNGEDEGLRQNTVRQRTASNSPTFAALSQPVIYITRIGSAAPVSTTSISVDVRYFYIISDVIRNRRRNVTAILLERTLSTLGDPLFSLIVRRKSGEPRIFLQCMTLVTMTNGFFS